MRQGIPARVEEESARGHTLGGSALQLPVSLDGTQEINCVVSGEVPSSFGVFQLLRKAEQVQEQQLKA